MTKKDKVKKIRISLDLTPKEFEMVEELERLYGCESKAKTIRDALKRDLRITRMVHNGDTIRREMPNGEIRGIVLIDWMSLS